MSDVRIRKVKVLKGRAKIEAEKQELNLNDLVIVTTKINIGSLPEYSLEKIEGDPTSYLLKRLQKRRLKTKNEKKKQL